MSAVQKLGMPGLGSAASEYGGACRVGGGDAGVLDQFPAGLRVLVVDDDSTWLKVIEQMLRKCQYQATICSQATTALSLLRERKGCFDLVMSDVHMPDMDGFKLLEIVGLEMDLPVIMMSADGRTSAVMKGIKHGACDYLIKPVRLEELKNIWQHVIRKKWNENKEHEHSGSLEDSDHHRRGADDAEYASSVTDVTDSNWKTQKKKRDAKEDEDDSELENDDPSASKKPRVVWSVDLHQQFVSAVNQLGIDKAVPKRILELMNVPGLTRENVASHLQKFRLYLKRLSGVAQHQGGLTNSFCGPVETTVKGNPLSRLDFQSLAASGSIPPQTLAALHAELLGRPSSGVVLPALDQPALVHSSIQGPKCIPTDCGVAFSQPLINCQSNIGKQFPQTRIAVEDMTSGFGSWTSNHLPTVGTTEFGGLSSPQNGNMMVQMLQQQRQQQQTSLPQPVRSEPNHVTNVQPSCLVVPCQSSNSFQVGNNPVPLNQNSFLVPSQLSNTFQIGSNYTPINQHSSYSNCSTVTDHSIIHSQPNNIPMGTGQVDGDFKDVSMLNEYSFPGSISSSVLPCSVRNDSGTGWRIPNSALNGSPASRLPGSVPNFCDFQTSVTNTGFLSDLGLGKNLGFVGKGTCIPSRFALDDFESPVDDMSQKKSCIGDDGGRVKQEIQLDFMEGSRVGNPVLAHISPSDSRSILSK